MGRDGRRREDKRVDMEKKARMGRAELGKAETEDAKKMRTEMRGNRCMKKERNYFLYKPNFRTSLGWNILSLPS